MAPRANDTQSIEFRQDDFQAFVRDTMRDFVRIALTTILEEEVTALIGAAPYEHNPIRRDHRNGSYTRDLDTSVGRIEDLPVPRTRRGHRTQLFERYHRRQPAVDQGIGEMFIRGISTQGVGQVLAELTGLQPSASSVSRVFHKLDDEFEAWKKRPLAQRYVYCFADGTYFSVIYQDEGCKMPILAVIGIRPDGTREVLGFSVGDRENEDAWKQLLDNLRGRGVEQVDLWITDGNRAMLNAIEAKFPQAKRQRCIKHKMDNVLSQHELRSLPKMKICYPPPTRATQRSLS